MMELDEAIKHCEDKAKELRKEKYTMALTGREQEWADCLQCAEEHEQLAEWLKDYKRLLAERGAGEERTTEYELIKRAVLILCRNVRPDGDIGYLDWEDRCKMQEIYHELVKQEAEE